MVDDIVDRVGGGVDRRVVIRVGMGRWEAEEVVSVGDDNDASSIEDDVDEEEEEEEEEIERVCDGDSVAIPTRPGPSK